MIVLGGPSVSGAPEMYPDIDYLHIGELGDATDALIARLDESMAPPPAQIRFDTASACRSPTSRSLPTDLFRSTST